jgi:phosphate transport system protein
MAVSLLQIFPSRKSKAVSPQVLPQAQNQPHPPIFFALSHSLLQYGDKRIFLLPRIHFHQQLADLKDRLLAMAALAQQAVEAAVDAYINSDSDLCQYVRENETAINLAQREVDEWAHDLLAKEQPMAVDLRFILAVIKINGDLERIGDQAVSIARRTQEIIEDKRPQLPADIARMGTLASRMIRTSILALLDGDAQIADTVIAMDDEIDDLNRESQAALLDYIQKSPQSASHALLAIMVARSLERISDHATNIATDVIFWVRGADLRHQASLAEAE